MLSPGDVYEVVSFQSFSQQVFITTLHVKCLTAISGAQAKFQTLADAWKEVGRPWQSPALSYVSWKATQVAGDGVSYDAQTCRRTGGDVYEGQHTGTLIGGTGSASQAGPSYEALVTALKTGLAGRSRHGSFYLGGFNTTAKDATDVNKWAAVHLGNIQTNVNAFLVAYGGGAGSPDFQWVVFSKQIACGCKYQIINNKIVYAPFTPGNQAAAKADVKSGTCRTLVVPMNRRKEGRGI